MKTILLALFICALVPTKSVAQEKLPNVLQIFKVQSKLYLDDVVIKEYPAKMTTSQTEELRSRLAVFEYKISYLNSVITKDCTENKITEPLAIANVTAKYYKDNFSTLPKEFFDKTEAEVKKL